MQDIKAVIFDIGNVLIEWQPERFYDAEIGEARRRAMFNTVDLHGMNDRVDRGGDFRGVIYDTADAYPEFGDEIRMWHDRWLELATPEITLSVHTLSTLRARGTPVFALTNFGKDSFTLAEKHYPFLKFFDRRYISGHMGVIKPEPRIYEMVEADCGLSGGDILFTDDRQDNIDAANARGWQTHLFEGAEGWVECLVQAGLLTREEATV